MKTLLSPSCQLRPRVQLSYLKLSHYRDQCLFLSTVCHKLHLDHNSRNT